MLKKNKINIILSLAVSILLFLFAPMELYLSNKDFFFFEGKEVLNYTILMACAFFVLLVFSLCFINRLVQTGWKYTIGILFCFYILLYFQGNFWLVNYGSLDGEAIDWSKYSTEGIVDVLIWIGVLILGILLIHKLNWQKCEKIISYVCVCIILIQCVTIISLFVGEGGFSKEPKYLSTNEYEFDYSQEENLIVIMLDSFDASVMTELLEGEDSEKYSDILADFTFYPDTTGMYSYTALAVPYILTGKEYLNETTYGEWLEQAYEQSPLLSTLREEGWRVGIYNTTLLPQKDTSIQAENVKLVHNSVSSHKRLLQYYYKLIAYRYSPQPLKRFFWFYADEISTELQDNEEGVELFSEDNFVFRRNYLNSIKNDSTIPTFRFYSLFGAHQPYHTTEVFEYSDEETDVYQTSKGVLKMIDEYLDALRETGVYDNSNIVILADHGIINRFNPLFMVKYAGTSGKMDVSEIPFSYAALQNVLVGLVDGNTKEETESIIIDCVPKDRTFLYYSHNTGEGYDNYFDTIERFIIKGDVRSDDSIVSSGTTYYRKDS